MRIVSKFFLSIFCMLREREGEKQLFFFFFVSLNWCNFGDLQYFWCVVCHWESPYDLDPSFFYIKQASQPDSPTCSCFPGWKLMSSSGLTAWMSVKERGVAQCLIKSRGVHVFVWVGNGVIWTRAVIERVYKNGKVNLNLDNASRIHSLPSGYPSF